MKRLVAGLLAAAAGLAVADEAVNLPALDRLGRELALARCARPVEVKTVLARAEQPGAPDDEMESVTCAGLRIAILRSPGAKPPREKPMSLVVEAPHPRLPAALAVGATPEAVSAALGPASVMLGDNLVYALGGRDTLTFEVQAGRVRAVTWTWDVD